MKNATPSDIAINNVLNEIDELISFAKVFVQEGHAYAPNFLVENKALGHRFDRVLSTVEHIKTLGYINDKQFSEIKTHFTIKSEAVLNALLDVSTDYLNTNNGGHIADVVEGVFNQPETNLFIERMLELRKSIEKCLSKEEKAKGLIKGLKQPFSWENITMIFDGAGIEVLQDDRKLGFYSLDELNFPKHKTNKEGKILQGVRGLFMSLFFNTTKASVSVLSSENNNNQKIKSNLSRTLCYAFNTNKDPIKIVDDIYRPIFKARFGGELRVNEHRSGGELFENYEY